jgi:hypothetical protein
LLITYGGEKTLKKSPRFFSETQFNSNQKVFSKIAWQDSVAVIKHQRANGENKSKQYWQNFGRKYGVTELEIGKLCSISNYRVGAEFGDINKTGTTRV